MRNNSRSLSKQSIKQKKAKSGNSQFIRAKLEEEYQPTIRPRRQIFSLSHISSTEKYQTKIKQENEMCNKALNQLRLGYSIKIDWNTKTNFRTTKAIFFPKVKTEPHQSMSTPLKSILNIKRSKRSHTMESINEKQQKLSKLLFKRHKKNHLITKSQHKQECRLFGEEITRQNTMRTVVIPDCLRDKNELKKQKSPTNRLSMVEVQQDILNNSTLKILKQELKAKFTELRRSFAHKKKYRRHNFTNLSEEELNDLISP